MRKLVVAIALVASVGLLASAALACIWDGYYGGPMGGPMMGTPIASLDAPVIKISSGVLAFTADETARPKEYPCIRCGRCVEACPYFLNPSKLARLAKARLFEEMKKANVSECVECGSCTYSCPSGIPIVQLIRTAKSDIRHKKSKAK